MIAQCLNVLDVAICLGHSHTSTTLNIYTHAFMDANTRRCKRHCECIGICKETGEITGSPQNSSQKHEKQPKEKP